MVRHGASVSLGALVAVFPSCLVALAEQPVVDAHIHYSHDAWEYIPPSRALEILLTAGVRRAFVSSSSDRGTQKLYQLDPDRNCASTEAHTGVVASWDHGCMMKLFRPCSKHYLAKTITRASVNFMRLATISNCLGTEESHRACFRATTSSCMHIPIPARWKTFLL